MKRIWILGFMLLLMCGCGRQAEVIDEEIETEQGTDMSVYDFSEFKNVEITGCNLNNLSETEQAVLYQQARYCQAMTDADTDTITFTSVLNANAYGAREHSE